MVGRSAVAAKIKNIYVKRTVNQLISVPTGRSRNRGSIPNKGKNVFVFQSVQTGS